MNWNFAAFHSPQQTHRVNSDFGFKFVFAFTEIGSNAFQPFKIRVQKIRFLN